MPRETLSEGSGNPPGRQSPETVGSIPTLGISKASSVIRERGAERVILERGPLARRTVLESLSRHLCVFNSHRNGVHMLVLSRRPNESLMINEDIKITVLEVRGDKVRLGIEAPTKHTIHRSEVTAAIQAAAAEQAGA